MPSPQADRLRQRLLEAAEQAPPHIEGLAERPVFILAPSSFLATMSLGLQVVGKLGNVVAAVDDYSPAAHLFNVPRINSAQFLATAAQHADAVAIDCSGTPQAHAFFDALCRAAGVPRYDLTTVQLQFDNCSAVYETAQDYRARTLARLDELLAFAERLEDDWSRQTLYANLLFRLKGERGDLFAGLCSSASEYFCTGAGEDSFILGEEECFVDCGASSGPTVARFLTATRYRYRSITAFEPDRINFAALEKSLRLPLAQIDCRNQAVGKTAGKLAFVETGGLGSHLSAAATGLEVDVVALDDVIEHASFVKMDVEGAEPAALAGARQLIARERPRMAVCVYHYADDLLDCVAAIDAAAEGYHYRLRQHYGYYYDLILYAAPRAGVR